MASTDGLNAAAIGIAGAGLLFRGYLLFNRLTWMIPERWITGLTLGYLAFYLSEFFLFGVGFLSATVHLVLFVMLVRLFSAHRDRDYYFLSAIAFLMVLAAALLTVNGIFLLGFAGFMLTAVVTFVLMEMRYVSAKTAVHSHPLKNELATRGMATSLAVASPALVICIAIGAVGIFFLLPRVSAGY